MQSDLLVTLIVIVCTGVVVAAIFIISHRRAAAREQALRLYCDQHGLSYEKRSEPLFTEVRIAGTDWQMTSELKSLRNDAQAGSNSQHRMTVWQGARRGTNPPYILGSVPATEGWEKMPSWIQGMIVQKMSAVLDIDMANYRGRTLFQKRSTAYLLFEKDDGSPLTDFGIIEMLLREWPESMPVVIRADENGVNIKIDGFFISDPAMVDRLVRLGKAVAEL